MTSSGLPPQGVAVIAANSGWNILNFRKPVVEALLSSGWRVIAIAAEDGSAAKLRSLGAEFVPIAIEGSGTSVLRDAHLLRDYRRFLRAVRPHVLLAFTIKPNIYGSLAAAGLGIKVVNTISGLGSAFLRPGPLNWFVRRLYRLALRRSACVFFQNSQDLELFVAGRLVRPSLAKLVPGSGIDLEHFRPAAERGAAAGRFRFLFIGRLLRDKGLIEYAEAARLLRRQWPLADFAILGSAGSDNPSAVPIAEVQRWQAQGLVSYFGETDDVRPYIAQADCIVLPSYREGLSRSLLEAAAMARPAIASDVPGCSAVVDHGKTGLLCAARSPQSLAEAMDIMLRLDGAERTAMGKCARQKVEQEFDQALVVSAYQDVLR